MNGSGRQRPGLKGARRPWTEEEVAVLKRLYRTRSNSQISRILRRTVAAVLLKANRLNLLKGTRRLKKMGRENVRRRWQQK